MDKRCLAKATKEALLAIVAALISLTLTKVIFKPEDLTYPIILLFAIMYGLGFHAGFVMGYNYKNIPIYISFCIPACMILILPCSNYYLFMMMLLFTTPYLRNLKYGKNYYDKKK